MTFLNTALMIGLAATALPLLIHLFSRRKFPLINFSSLRFLKQLRRQQMRTLRLRQWLLLLLRTLGILLIALAFTRPALKSIFMGNSLSVGRTSAVILLDASASMQARSSQGSGFERGQGAVRTILSSLNAGDRALVILVKGTPTTFTPALTNDREYLLRLLEATFPWDGSADFSAAVQLGIESLGEEQDFRREFYLLSDFCSDSLLPPPPEAAIPFFIRIEPESDDNLSVTQVRALNEIIEPGQEVDLELTLTNHSERNREEVYYSLFLNGNRVAEDLVSIASRSEVKRVHQVIPERAGLQEGIAQIEERDALILDNRAYYCFSIPDSIKVLLVGEGDNRRALELALAPSPSIRGGIRLQTASSTRWESGPLSDFQVIIFVEPLEFTTAQAQRLIRFVENGGGLLLFPGSRTDITSINRELLIAMEGAVWGEKIGPGVGRESFLTWQPVDLEDPLFRGMFRSGNRPESPHIYQALHLVGKGFELPLMLSNDWPFIVEWSWGRGRVTLSASSPDPNWSDWAYRGIFAPLLHRLTLRLGSTNQNRCQSLIVGQDYQTPAHLDHATSATVVTPTGDELQLPPQLVGHELSYRISPIEQAGLYRLRAGSTEHLAAVRLPQQESNLRINNPLTQFPDWEAVGAIETDPKSLSEAINHARYGREIWKSMLIGGLILLLAETLVGSSFKRADEESAERIGE